MPILNIPASWVGVGATGDPVIVGGSGACSTNDGDASYAEVTTPSLSTIPYDLGVDFPATPLDDPYDPTLGVEVVVVYRENGQSPVQADFYSDGVGYVDDLYTNSLEYVEATMTLRSDGGIPLGELVATGAWQAGEAPYALMRVFPGVVVETPDSVVARFTYIGLRITTSEGGLLLVPPLRLYPREDGRGASTAQRVYPPPRSTQQGRTAGAVLN